MCNKLQALAAVGMVLLACAPVDAQRVQFPQAPSGLRPIAPGQGPTTGHPIMVPINPATQSGIYPSTGLGSPTFDPYATTQTSPLTPLPLPGVAGAPTIAGGPVLPSSYPGYTGTPPVLPGAGQSGVIGTFPNAAPTYAQPGIYPNSSPSALFPGTTLGGGSGSLFGGIFGNSGGIYPPGYGPGGGGFPSSPSWNPSGTIFGSGAGYPQFLRLFQGVRFRHAWLYGSDDSDALTINDSDLALAFAIPNFFYSTQPLYLMPSFSLHQWSGPRPPSTADLPAVAYSAFLDSGWQSDPTRILGAELGLRVGMFSDFDTATSDSLRVMGRGIGRVRVTPRATLKLGVLYLDRNRIKLLPAGGLLWQPNPQMRFDLFFPEPKLARYLSTVGTADMWGYVAGYYGGGAWTIQRAAGTTDSIDINDLRVVLGLEWGRNDQMREGRRFGFVEVGYVFNRELRYDASPMDNLDLQDTVMIRAGIGY